ncbi:MAG: hypothetical protein EKK54_05545 [Neisseriaceae bacterium]|nr:MAG: hypothetical protein EKK54_05545 [Neisseriaceae bacterium]
MAIYNLQIKTVSRSDGHSATAKIAYIARAIITDDRTSKIHNYTRKSTDLMWSEITHGDTTIDTIHRSEIWNAAEAADNRSNSRTAREYVIALPQELTIRQNIELTREFARLITSRYKNVADWAIHNESDDNGNVHAHILTTTRIFDSNTYQLKAKTDIELDNGRLIKEGKAITQDQIKQIRLDWETIQNRHLQLAGVDQEVCCSKKLDRQTVKKHLGREATQLERQGIQTNNGDHNRQIDQYYRELFNLNFSKKYWQKKAKKLEKEKNEIEKELKKEIKINETKRQSPDPINNEKTKKRKYIKKHACIYSTDLIVLFDFAREYGQYFTRYYDHINKTPIWITKDKKIKYSKKEIQIMDPDSRPSIELAIELAQRQFGNQLNLVGNDGFIDQAIDIIANNEKYKNVELKNQDHQKKLETKKLQKSKQKHKLDIIGIMN